MNDIYSVIYSPEATEDLREIYYYIAVTIKVSSTAKAQIERIRKVIRSLDFMPFRNVLVKREPWKSLNMYRVIIDNFVVFYTVDEISLKVCIIRIVYGGRDLISLSFNKTE